MKKFMSLCLGVIAIGCSAVPVKDLVRADLYGKPLIADDFTVIVGDRVVKTFYTRTELGTVFPGIRGDEKMRWQWSVLAPENPQELKIADYQTDTLRFVYFPEDTDGQNSYMGLKKGALTLRGIGIGDSTSKTLELYGKNDWADQHAEKVNTGGLGFDYRFYGYPESAKSKYPFYDFIEFESKDGIIVGIHFWRKQSDAE